MLRREFLKALAVTAILPPPAQTRGQKIVDAARKQIGITLTYDPAYVRLQYPNGDVPRSKGICADVVVRACRDALSLDLQKLVHEDMLQAFAAYPSRKTWGNMRPDASIDHRRVLNLEAFWLRQGNALWRTTGKTAGDAFPKPVRPGDFVTWMLNGHLPHVGVIGDEGPIATVIHNVGRGVEETPLSAFALHPAHGHFRWPG